MAGRWSVYKWGIVDQFDESFLLVMYHNPKYVYLRKFMVHLFDNGEVYRQPISSFSVLSVRTKSRQGMAHLMCDVVLYFATEVESFFDANGRRYTQKGMREAKPKCSVY